LWFVGDLVNRGPQSLDALRFVRDLGDAAITVLGNHDLHLLAAAAGVRRIGTKDTFTDVLDAPDSEELIEWLCRRPLLHFDSGRNTLLIHAGLAPQWDVATAVCCAGEVETVLRSAGRHEFLGAMYGDEPDQWRDDLQGIDRLRFILNCFTRLRLCDPQGRLRIAAAGAPYGRGDSLLPWFDVPGRCSAGVNIIFGHWSMLGRYQAPRLFGLDSGCVWGGALSALRVDAAAPEWYGVECPMYCKPGGGQT
jgi:bis(5'-nucleosyl)-tetraphosphatase (symmetrical)